MLHDYDTFETDPMTVEGMDFRVDGDRLVFLNANTSEVMCLNDFKTVYLCPDDDDPGGYTELNFVYRIPEGNCTELSYWFSTYKDAKKAFEELLETMRQTPNIILLNVNLN